MKTTERGSRIGGEWTRFEKSRQGLRKKARLEKTRMPMARKVTSRPSSL